MQNVITIGPELIPVEQIAYIEPFEPSGNGQFKPDKPYKGLVVLLNRETVLAETTPAEFAETNGFHLLPARGRLNRPMLSCEDYITFLVGPNMQQIERARRRLKLRDFHI